MALPIAGGTRILERGARPRPGENLGLWIDRLIPRREEDWSLKDRHRSLAFDPLCTTFTSLAGKDALTRQRDSVERLFGSALSCELSGKVDGRLLVDYGRATAAQAGLSFHSLWGLPRIPGSALSGVTRAYMLQHAEDWNASLDDIFGTGPHRDVPALRSARSPSGTSGQAGLVCFFDALPAEGRFTLSMDVLTPHYGDYYREKEPPADYLSPVPFSFLSVVDTSFVMHLGAEVRGENTKRSVRALEAARRGLALALVELGVGAKTAAGYGRLSIEEKRA